MPWVLAWARTQEQQIAIQTYDDVMRSRSGRQRKSCAPFPVPFLFNMATHHNIYLSLSSGLLSFIPLVIDSVLVADRSTATENQKIEENISNLL